MAGPGTRTCDGCSRGITPIVWKTYHGLQTHMYHQKRDETEEKKDFCGDCREEIVSFVGDTLDLSDIPPDEVGECGFCQDADSVGSFSFRRTHTDVWDSVHLCESCYPVVATFVDGVPEEEYSGDLFRPSEVRSCDIPLRRSDVDLTEVSQKALDFGEGDTVRLRVHDTPDNDPEEYLEVTADVVSVIDDPLAPLMEVGNLREWEGCWLGPTPVDLEVRPDFERASVNIDFTAPAERYFEPPSRYATLVGISLR